MGLFDKLKEKSRGIVNVRSPRTASRRCPPTRSASACSESVLVLAWLGPHAYKPRKF